MKSNGVSRDEVGPKKRENSEGFWESGVGQGIKPNEYLFIRHNETGLHAEDSLGSMEEIQRKMEGSRGEVGQES